MRAMLVSRSPRARRTDGDDGRDDEEDHSSKQYQQRAPFLLKGAVSPQVGRLVRGRLRGGSEESALRGVAANSPVCRRLS